MTYGEAIGTTLALIALWIASATLSFLFVRSLIRLARRLYRWWRPLPVLPLYVFEDLSTGARMWNMDYADAMEMVRDTAFYGRASGLRMQPTIRLMTKEEVNDHAA